MDNRHIRITSQRREYGCVLYVGRSLRSPLYTFEVCVEPQASDDHDIWLYGVSRISQVRLNYKNVKHVSLPGDDYDGHYYHLSPLQEQILRDIDAHFQPVTLRIVS